MTLRPLSEKDFVFIADERKNFPDGWNYEMLVSAFKTGRFFGFVAEESAPFAFITYSVLAPDADIESVYVQTEQRRKGVADTLIAAAVNDMRERGVKKIFLEVRESNLPAINLYVKHGFGKISERKKYYGSENAAVFVREIKS